MSSDNITSIKEFLADFVDSSFNLLLQNATDSFTSEIQDQLSLHKIEYMLFISWFVKFQRSRCIYEIDATPDYVSGALLDECYILFTKYLRESYEQKNWPVVHAGMLLFTEYLEFLLSLDQSWEADVQAVISKILSENMLQLLASLPKSATSHSSQYVKACINSVSYTHLDVYKRQFLNLEEPGLKIWRKARARKCYVEISSVKR